MELEVELGNGKSAAGCRGCGKVFSSDTGFDRHIRQSDTGTVHLDPVDLGMVQRANGHWSLPGNSPVFATQSDLESPNTTTLVSLGGSEGLAA